MGLHLYVFTDGHQQPDRIIERYFDETLVVDVPLQGASTDDRVLSYAVDQLCYPSLSGLTGAALVDRRRQQALAALKAAPSTAPPNPGPRSS